jgi:hypothetical protein
LHNDGNEGKQCKVKKKLRKNLSEANLRGNEDESQWCKNIFTLLLNKLACLSTARHMFRLASLVRKWKNLLPQTKK